MARCVEIAHCVEVACCAEVARHFEFEGDFLDARPYGCGHINDTYIVRCRTADGVTRRYTLQRINHHVFQDPEALTRNIEAVTAHLRRKVLAAGGDPERETLTLVPAENRSTLHRTDDGDYWRAYLFIEGARTHESVESLEQVYSAAQAFGRFQELLSDFPPDQLHETIPDFHNTPKRFAACMEAVKRDTHNRARAAAAEIAFVTQRAGEVSILVDLLAQGALPERVTHNDTKLNNVMIDDETGMGICVIDLDTVMPGLSLYDFGDTVRSSGNPAAEDERDLAKVGIDLAVFDALTRGYLEATRDFLTPAEVDLLPFSARLMTLECGMRFLTDHLNGDVYFKTHRENHNLDRCRAQFKMVAEMEERFGEMVGVVEGYREGRQGDKGMGGQGDWVTCGE